MAFKFKNIKLSKYDIAPISFFFDIFPTDLFKIPIIPLPMRIDKIINGKPTLIILPDEKKIYEVCKEKNLNFNFKEFVSIGLSNLINYTKQIYSKTYESELNEAQIKRWFSKTINIHAEIPELKDLFSYINIEFLKIFSQIKYSGGYLVESNDRELFIQYCEKVLNYIEEIIKKNKIKIGKEDNPSYKQLYFEKDSKYYPEILDVEITHLLTHKSTKKKFLPYLIIDDIFDCFAYNKKLLEQNQQQSLIVYEYKNIINKGSSIGKTINSSKRFSLKDININDLLK